MDPRYVAPCARQVELTTCIDALEKELRVVGCHDDVRDYMHY